MKASEKRQRKSFLKRLLSGVLLAVLSASLFGCSTSPYPDDYYLLLVETTQQKEHTVLTYYDKDFNVLYKKGLPYGSLEGVFYQADVYKGQLFGTPTGTPYSNPLLSIQYDLATGNYTTAPLPRQVVVLSSAMNKDYYYTVNAKPGFSSLTQRNRQTGEVKIYDDFDYILSPVKAYDDGLVVAFGEKGRNDGAIFFFNEESMKPVKVLSTSEAGRVVGDVLRVEDFLYFTYQYRDIGDNSAYNDVLVQLSVKDYSLQTYHLDTFSPRQIIPFKGKLLIFHNNIVAGEEKSVSVFDEEKGVVEQRFELKDEPYRVVIQGDILYTISKDDLYLYDLSGGGFDFIRSVPISTMKNDLCHYYVVGLFPNYRLIQ